MNPFRRMAQYNTARQFRVIKMLSLICLLVLAFLSSVLYINVILNRNRVYVERIIEQCLSNVEQRAFEAAQFVQTLAYDSTIALYLQESDLRMRNEYSRKVSSFLSNMKTVQPQISDVFLFRHDDSGETFICLQPNQTRLLEQINYSRVPVILGFYPHSGAMSSEDMVLYVGCSIYDTDSPSVIKPRIGGVIAAMSLEYMNAELRELTQMPGLKYTVVSKELDHVCGTLPEFDAHISGIIESACLENRECTVNSFGSEFSIAPILGTQGSLIIYTNRIEVLKDMLVTSMFVLVITAFIYLLLLYVFRLTRRSVSQPIENLTRALVRNPETPLPIEGNMDIQVLTATLNKLFKSERHLTETLIAANNKLYESQLAQNKLELQFLRSQINPHFIYNTLEVIRSISIINHNREIAEMVKSLAAILRYSIKGGESVMLKDELRIIRCYLSIQSIRFGDRFEYSIDVSPEAELLTIPRMCLQPLVENAFVHGLENKLENGKIFISAYINSEELIIVVKDNGAGLSVEKRDELNRMVQSSIKDMDSNIEGVGLVNVARRIQIARGNEFGMQIDGAPEAGMSVTFKLPVRKEGI